MAKIRPIDITKEVYYGAEASKIVGEKVLAHTVYRYNNTKGDKVGRVVKRTVYPKDAESSRCAVWSFSKGSRLEKSGTYTNRSREVKNYHWFCTNTSSYKLDEQGKYVAERKLSWLSLPLPSRFGEIYSLPSCGEKLDIYTDGATLHYVNEYLTGVKPPEKHLMPNCLFKEK